MKKWLHSIANKIKKTEPEEKEKKPPKSGPKKKRNKRRIILISLGAVILIILAYSILKPNDAGASMLAYDDTTVLAYRDFSNTISATGTVESVSSTMVYSTLAYKVKNVPVSVGDYVKKGQLLAELDEQNILNQIESQEAGMSTSSASSAQQIRTAQDNYNQYKHALDSGLNSSINAALTQVENAYDNYIKATNAYERYREALNLGENTTILAQESALQKSESAIQAADDACDNAEKAANRADTDWRNARADISSARNELNSLNQQLYSTLAADPTADVSALETAIVAANANISALERQEQAAEAAYDAAVAQKRSAERALEDAEASYKTAQAQYNAALTSVDDALSDYATAMDNAYKTYQDAQTNLDATRLAAENQLKSYQNSINSAKTNANDAPSQVNIRHLRVDLESTSITAPASGTVTAVYAEIGGSGSGLLFVIEDVDNLIVETSVKEYDIASVSLGMGVRIKSEAAGSKSYDGEITSIAPTSNKTPQGLTNTIGDVQFATDVKVISKDTDLRIGMNVRLNLIIDEQSGVLAVPYDAVYENSNGESCVIFVEEQPDGKHILRELPVTVGIENDLDIVISGPGVEVDLRVVNTPDAYMTMIDKEIHLSSAAAVSYPPFTATVN